MPRILPFAAVMAGLTLVAAARPAEDDAKPLGSDGCNHTFERAGHPDEISCVAKPGLRPNYCGYYVGGGCVCGTHVCRGGPPAPLQGTFGWDYCCGPCGLKHRVMLGWCFHCRPKGGTGQYKTEGPHVPNPLAIQLGDTHGNCEVCSHR